MKLKMMKKNAVIINTARGNLVDEKDFKEALENRYYKRSSFRCF